MEFKCEFLLLRTKDHLLSSHITPIMFQLKNWIFSKNLGVVMDSKLTWKEHIKQVRGYVLSKANAALSFSDATWEPAHMTSGNTATKHLYDL